jgi:hypothetical protein
MAPTAASIILTDARALVARGWCQSRDARDAGGRTVAPGSPDACCWSLLGAIVASSGGPERLRSDRRTLADVAKASLAIGLATGEESLRDWNDAPGRTSDEVVAAFDDALALLDRFLPTSLDLVERTV